MAESRPEETNEVVLQSNGLAAFGPGPGWAGLLPRRPGVANGAGNGAALPGLVLEVYVPSDRVGTHVKAGQPLFRVDDRHLQAQLKVAEAQHAAAVARLAKLEKQPRPEE